MPPPERKVRRVRCGIAFQEGKLRFEVDDESFSADFNISSIGAHAVADIPDIALDLAEISGYIYAADAAVPRGSLQQSNLGRSWRRNFQFTIPVRCFDFWNEQEVKDLLIELVGFLSDDDYEFNFRPGEQPPTEAPWLGLEPPAELRPETIMLFSGGLDSLGGALHEMIEQKRQTLFITHASSTKMTNAKNRLLDQLRKKTSQRMFRSASVTLTLGKNAKEASHRTRSFLFASIAAVAAHLHRQRRICFYENGVTSLNLPLSSQVAGALATRSTHPKALRCFSKLFSRVFAGDFRVDNPFTWRTKTEVLQTIAQLGGAELIGFTRSCALIREATNAHPHCGRCSQCVDRRFAAMAAGLADADPQEYYRIDVLHGKRAEVRDRELALGYVNNARLFQHAQLADFFQEFPEAHRALPYYDEEINGAAQRVFDLHRRHGRAVGAIVDEGVTTILSSGAMAEEDSLLALVGSQQFKATDAPELRAGPDESTRRHLVRFELRIDFTMGLVELGGVGRLTAAPAALLVILATRFLEDRGRGCRAENYQLVAAPVLAEALAISEEALRRRINRLRAFLEQSALAHSSDAPDISSLIETIPRKGYRLNPNTVEVVSLTLTT